MSLNKKQLKDVDVGGKRGIFVRVYVGGGGVWGRAFGLAPFACGKPTTIFLGGPQEGSNEVISTRMRKPQAPLTLSFSPSCRLQQM
jgi:hypothetical protein